jgi:hypothetical protein
LQGVPVSLPAIKTNAGSWIELVESGTDAGPYIYLHKSKFHHLHRYDLSTESWETGLLPGMPFVGRSGRSKKSKDGGSAATFDGRIYALKGGNTCEFWRYTPAGDSWFELDPIPEIGSSGKKKRVKNGADIVSLGEGSFFVTKGNKTVECWRVAVAETDADLTRPGVLASGIRREASGVLRVSPNPLRSGFATLQVNSQWSGSPARVSIFDASGRCVLSSSFGIRTSSLPLDLRSMQAGVYLLKLESGSRTTTQKLVIQR